MSYEKKCSLSSKSPQMLKLKLICTETLLQVKNSFM